MSKLFLLHAIGSLLPLVTLSAIAVGAEYRLEEIAEAAPADDLSAAVQEALAAEGVRVVKGESRTVLEFWPRKSWPVKAGFERTPERLYPFEVGELIGVVRLRRRGSDFRDQDISRGVYTLRYGLQPVDGNHEGTSPTRDFVVMIRAEDDTSTERMAMKAMLEASAEAAGSNHPAMLCLQRVDEQHDPPSLHHMEEQDWWVLRVEGGVTDSDKKQALELIVVGHADE